MYAWVVIFEHALAVGTRLKYTGSMLWKFKKSEPSQAPSSSVSSQANQTIPGADKLPTSATARVENQDIVNDHREGAYVIPASYRISGSLVTNRHVIVQGDLHGAGLIAPSVHVGPTGRLNIPTQASLVTVSGAVESPISARENVEVRAGGSVRGDIESGGLTILPGGIVSGARLAIGPLRRREA